jgi:hypothetical protein
VDGLKARGVTVTPEQLQSAGEQALGIGAKPESATPFMREDAELRRLQAERAALPAGDPRIAATDEQIARFQAHLASKGMEITTNPDGTSTIRTAVPTTGRGAAGGLTTASQTAAQGSLQASLDTISTVDRLLPLISSETVGPRAYLGEIVMDKVLATLVPSLASQDRAVAKTVIAELRASRVQELKTDGNIAEPERKLILESVPGIGALIDSPRNAANVARSIAKLSAMKAAVVSRKLGQPLPEPAVRTLGASELSSMIAKGLIKIGDGEIIDLAKRGLINADDARSLYNQQRGP